MSACSSHFGNIGIRFASSNSLTIRVRSAPVSMVKIWPRVLPTVAHRPIGTWQPLKTPYAPTSVSAIRGKRRIGR